MAHFPATQDAAESDRWYDRNHARLEQHGWGLWAVEVVGGAGFVGFTGLSVPGFEVPGCTGPCVEVGWRLAQEHWGRGYAPEAARAALAFGFDELDLDEIVSFTHVDNANSRRVMAKIGMTESHEFDHPLLPGSRVERHVLYRIARR